jgi:small subunit ribosomal protein S18
MSNKDTQYQIKNRTQRRRSCPFCVAGIKTLDYKALFRFKRFITDRGKIVPKRNSGMCAKHQRVLSEAVKRARYMGLVPYCID